MPTVLIAGGTGLIGTRLSHILQEKGYKVAHLSRNPDPNSPFQVYSWNSEKGTLDMQAFQDCNYIINLAGARIADKNWSRSRKKRIISSRVNSALLISKYIADNSIPHLKAYISASAIGFYGNRGEELLDEDSQSGQHGFLPESVVAWENAIDEVAANGVRTVAFRIGIVLSSRGGALNKLMLPLKLLASPYFGNGQQWFSWIHIDDLCRLFVMAIEEEKINGAYNAVSPNPVRNKEFVETLKNAMHALAYVFPIPTFALRAAMGEMADVVLDSTKVASKKIEKSGFVFHFPELLPALHDILRRKI